MGSKRKYQTPQIGDEFTDWTVIDNKIIDIKKRSQYGVLCRCTCGVERVVRITALIKGLSKGCECRSIRVNKEKVSAIGDLSKTLYGRFKKSARIRGLEWDISMSFLWELYIKQNMKCALSNVKLHMQKQILRRKGESNITASLDRIDSSKGYVENNVQWVHKDVNKMKQDLNEEYFIGLCELIINNK